MFKKAMGQSPGRFLAERSSFSTPFRFRGTNSELTQLAQLGISFSDFSEAGVSLIKGLGRAKG
jgi:hypothetical protein